MAKKPIQRRNSAGLVELRADDDGVKHLVGYAAIFDDGTEGSVYRYGRVAERIAAGAFSRAIRDRQDVRALFNHDTAALLGRVSSKTLTLAEDAKGLRYDVALPNTQLAHDVAALVERGDLSGSSFAFRIRAEKWEKVIDDGGDEKYNRTITDLDLIDVSPVTFPAYEGTSVDMRSEDISAAEAEAEAALAAEFPDDEQRADDDAKRAEAEAEAAEIELKLALLSRK